MRRGIGVGGLQRQKAATEQFRAVGGELASAQLEQMKRQFAVFQSSLEDFAKKHRKDVSRNADFRRYFNEMCQKIGVDPLASQRGFWAQMLGVGDFYYELGVQIVDVCLRTRPANGGLIDVEELRARISRMRCASSSSSSAAAEKHHQHHQKKKKKAAEEISVDDIERAIKKLGALGGGFAVLSAGPRKLVQSVPCELSPDHTTALVLAQDTGFVTAQQLSRELGWDAARVDSVMQLLLAEGMAWVDSQFSSSSSSSDAAAATTERAFWFPASANVALE